MKVAFFTEMNFFGKISRTHENMRTEFAWMCALDADHYGPSATWIDKRYDLGIVIIPKKNPNFKENFPKQGKAWQENTRIFARR